MACAAAFTLPPTATRSRMQDGIPPAVVANVVDAVCKKQIVLLGELPSHGEAHAFDAKARIADALVARCGFSALLFEAGVYDFVGLARAVEAGSATPDQLDGAIGRFWWTRELAAWRVRLFEAASRRRLVIGGLDDQVSITADYAKATLPALIATHAPRAIRTTCAQAVSMHVNWAYDAKTPFDQQEQLRLRDCAHAAAGAANANRSLEPADRVMLESFARYADRQRSSAAMGRDESMYRNLIWYVEQLPANSRVVIWTATVHAARQRGDLAEIPLGARIVERWGDRAGAVGFTAYSGQTSRAGRTVSPIPDAPPGSLEAMATAASAWLDSHRLKRIGPVASRLLGRFVTATWSDYFDGVVVIRREVAPTFDPWK
jgi:erythromycin esterase-like protein